ncbi:MAG TPA: sugar phosphate isomerase/epimerase family protein [Opitutaceae bacterium]|jgi:hexulose-6-phosphate isomerase
MRPSVSIWSFPAALPLAAKFAIAREAGFEGFEIDLSEAGPVTLKSSPSDLGLVRTLADKHGLALSGLATGLYWGANAASADPAVRSRAKEILDRQIEVAAALGIDAVLVVPGAVGVDFIPGGEVVPYDSAWDRARTFVGSALPKAEKLGVTLGIENVWNKFLLSPREMREFIDSFSSPRVGAYFDVGNALAAGYPEHWISILGQRVTRVHLKDFRRNVATVDGFVDLLSGDVDWPSVVKALRSISYKGWCTAEMIPPVPFYKHAPEVLIHNTARAMRAIFAL